MWGDSSTKTYLLLILKQILHKILRIEYSIVSIVIYLDHHSLPFILSLQQYTLQVLEAFLIIQKQQIPKLGPYTNPYK